MILSIFGSISAIFIVIFIHELGHFLAARLLHVKILKFSIGFGPTVWSYTSKKTATVYALSIIPLGGYLKMYGEPESDCLEALRTDLAYSRKPIWARMMISFAGPFANMLLAVVMFSAVSELGVSYTKPLVGSVIPYSIAAKAGIKRGDELIQIGDQKIYGWEQVIMAFLPHVGDRKPLRIITKHHSEYIKHEMDLFAWRINARDSDIIHVLGFVPYTPSVPPLIAEVIPHSPAALAGMQTHDLILKINQTPIHSWSQVLSMIPALPNQEVMFLVKRDEQEKLLAVHLTSGHMGIMIQMPVLPNSMIRVIQYDFFDAIQVGIKYTKNLFFLNVEILKKMITGRVSLNTLSGPIAVFRTAGEASSAGVSVYLSFIGFISVALGFINLLPIPVLDGGAIFFQLIEFIMRRPLSLRYQSIGVKLGLFFLLCLMLQATVNDVLNLI